MDNHAEVIRRLIMTQKSIRVTNQGWSMYPMIHPGDKLTIGHIENEQMINPGSIPFIYLGKKKYSTHRLVAYIGSDQEYILTMGDWNDFGFDNPLLSKTILGEIQFSTSSIESATALRLLLDLSSIWTRMNYYYFISEQRYEKFIKIIPSSLRDSVLDRYEFILHQIRMLFEMLVNLSELVTIRDNKDAHHRDLRIRRLNNIYKTPEPYLVNTTKLLQTIETAFFESRWVLDDTTSRRILLKKDEIIQRINKMRIRGRKIPDEFEEFGMYTHNPTCPYHESDLSIVVDTDSLDAQVLKESRNQLEKQGAVIDRINVMIKPTGNNLCLQDCRILSRMIGLMLNSNFRDTLLPCSRCTSKDKPLC